MPSVRSIAVCLALATAVAGLYAQTGDFEFVAFDDGEYVVDNPWLNRGFSAEGVRWAFFQTHAGNWHPLTWLSHMQDCQAFGLRPGPPHLVNAALHAVNAVLLLALLWQLTGAFWRPALAAGLFAVHPLRAESVAWVSERKDVLCLALGLAALLAYVGYARSPNGRRYLLVALLLGLGLLAKQLLVTLPALMLLLDYWPLERSGANQQAGARPRSARRRRREAPDATGARSWRDLALEKLPLLTLAAAAGAMTVVAQNRAGAISGLAVYSLGYRLQNAVVAYALYVKMFLWPTELVFVYPHHGAGWPMWQVVAGAALLLSVTGGAYWLARKGTKYPLVGWLWFLVALVPNIGLVQAGAQALADRYSYLSGIGLAIIAAWGLGDAAMKWRWLRAPLAATAGVWLAALFGLAFRQIGYWRSTETLIAQALEVDSQNYVAHKIMGSLLAERGDFAGALEQYRQGQSSDGRPVPETLTLMATALGELGDLPAAQASARRALQAQPTLVEAHLVLAKLALKQGDRDEARRELQTALEVDPNLAKAHANLGAILADDGDLSSAMSHARRAVELSPRSAPFVVNLGVVHLRLAEPAEALRQFERSAALDPQSADAWYHIGLSQAALGHPDSAEQALKAALRVAPTHALANFDLGRMYESRQEWGAAEEHYEAALAAQPKLPGAMNNLAWLLATCPEPRRRDGARAVELALAALELTPAPEAGLMDTLAAAYAESGRWPEAVESARKAIARAEQDQLPALVGELKLRLALYESSQPYRQGAASAKQLP